MTRWNAAFVAMLLGSCQPQSEGPAMPEPSPAMRVPGGVAYAEEPAEPSLTQAASKASPFSVIPTADVVAAGKTRPPNILVIWGDDIGWFNVSAYNNGIMGYRTPNIDRIAAEGMLFTDGYGEQSCTAGRATFITGQLPVRTGLTKVGMPGAPQGMQREDPTIAELLRPRGYRTGQFGKNHLGDRDEHLPTKHGFDEFFGNLYHLNAEEEPEYPDYPKNPAYKEHFGPRGVLHTYADGRFEDTGPLTKKRMETIDQETVEAAMRFIAESHEQGKPFFVWWNATRMHINTHLSDEYLGKTGLGTYPDGMQEHDDDVGLLLKQLDDLGIANDTIVIYSTDNGAEVMTWPDGGSTPFRGEKATCWEGGFRVPMMVRWPGHVPAGTVSNDVISNQDWMPTLLAAAGDPDVKEKLVKGATYGPRWYKVHLDGYNQLDLILGNGPSARKEIFYFTDDGDFAAIRYEDWKFVYMEQRHEGFGVWQEPFDKLRLTKIFNLRTDPFERGDEGIHFEEWQVEHVYLAYGAMAYAGQLLTTFKAFPQRQPVGSFNLDMIMKQVQEKPSRN